MNCQCLTWTYIPPLRFFEAFAKGALLGSGSTFSAFTSQPGQSDFGETTSWRVSRQLTMWSLDMPPAA